MRRPALPRTTAAGLAPALGLAALLLARPAAAAPGDSTAEGELESEAVRGADEPRTPIGDPARPWLRRWPAEPFPGLGEIGLFAGVLRVNDRHELFVPDPELQAQGHERVRAFNPHFGLRLGYFVLPWFGAEIEGAFTPTRLRDRDGQGLIYSARGQLVGQLGLWSVTPFVLVGGGVLGIASPSSALGSDLDPALHFGGGLKLFANRWLALRLDLRDLLSRKQGLDEGLSAHNFELTLGLSITVLRPRRR